MVHPALTLLTFYLSVENFRAYFGGWDVSKHCLPLPSCGPALETEYVA